MTDQEQITLPSARTAMRYAVALASDVTATEIDLDRARTWVVIAAELRAGAQPEPPLETELSTDVQGTNEFFAQQGAIRRAAGEGLDDMPAPPTYRDVVGDPATERLPVVMPRCAHCGLMIEWYAPGPGEAASPQWLHSITRQAVCPPTPNGPAEDMTVTVVHTFATPEVPGDGS